MVCGTCGSSGHNTTTCTVRKVTQFAGQTLGGLAGGAAGAHVGHPHAGAYAGGQAGLAATKAILETDGQKAYRNRNK